ncbi:chromosome partitioning protein ParA [Clostridium novyi B str. ATCC 27606]|uniref:Chromosome partitioning protein ParA n=2 Tax=Clostridium TaxID=1485 RepID=A0AA40ISX9_CLONO|nr:MULTISPECIES: MinD/ParA family protein [Clostridium]KEI13165.1 chromosome partitioning protein ParA [Clostridium novyi B str. NCTC 9691]KEI14375.1 chromosome partitioning protein ParA [Clostridium novyi B str. ATCC 27606]KEI16172.1 chromosome partitioning protein ParA [Clostridium haemolyticum NCTC 9693]KGN03740.1 chromosome partitioning protein ParA [Clostridium haemolyticum NCTC 8350]
MLDQAEKLRSLAKNNLQWNENYIKESKEILRTNIITITSGKGGVGKSNFVVNLGITLQRMGKKVLILDADVGMGNDDVLMGFLPKYNIYDIIFNGKTIDEVLIQGPYGIKLLPAGTGLNKIDELDSDKREKFLSKLEELNTFDFILMDTGAGINKNVLAFVECSEELIIVTTPEPTSLTDAYSLMKAIVHFNLKDKAKIVVNKVLDYEEGIKTFNKFNNAAKRFLNIELEYLGNISEDRKLIEAVRSQKPVVISYPNCKAAFDIEEIALKLCGYNRKMKTNGVQGVFKKIFHIFS